MKQVTYKTSWSRIIKKSILVLLPTLAHIAMIIYMVVQPDFRLERFLIINAFFALFSIPGLLLFIQYLNHARQVTIVLEYNKIRLINNDEVIELDNSQIDKIEVHSTTVGSSFPWEFLQSYVFRQGDKAITFNSFTLDLYDLWQSSLAQRISSDKIEHNYSWYPWMSGAK